jgi:hypothetical protein
MPATIVRLSLLFRRGGPLLGLLLRSGLGGGPLLGLLLRGGLGGGPLLGLLLRGSLGGGTVLVMLARLRCRHSRGRRCLRDRRWWGRSR